MIKIRGFDILCFFLCAMTGCTVGPDYHAPETAVPASWQGADGPAGAQAGAVTPGATAVAAWWEQFNDPILTSLVERAVRENLDARMAGARIRQARAKRGTAAAELRPEVNALAGYTYNREPPYSSDSSIAGSEGSLFQIGLDSSWELDLFGGGRRNVEAADADIHAAVEDRRDVLVTLLGDIGTNYITLRGIQRQIVIAREDLKSQQNTTGITRKRFQAGLVSNLDLTNAEAQAAHTESQIPVLESSARTAIYALSVLLALEPGELVKELGPDAPIPPVPPSVPVGLPSDLLRRRPDIRAAEARVHAATARIGVATADLFPKFSLTGSAMFSNVDVNDIVNWNGRTWSVGPSLVWPVFSAGRIEWNIETMNAREEEAFLLYRKTILTALKEVETALFAFAREEEHRKALMGEVELNRKAFDLSMSLYVVGKGDFLNVLIAERTLHSSEDALAQSVCRRSLDLVALYKALGGGWEAVL